MTLKISVCSSLKNAGWYLPLMFSSWITCGYVFFEKDRGGNNLHNWKVSRRIHWKICAYSSFLLFLYIAEQGEHLFNKYSLTFYREMDKKKNNHTKSIARWKIQNWERPNEGRYLISTPYAKLWWNLHICPSSKVASLVCPCHTKLQWKHFKIKSFNSIKLLFAIFSRLQ